MPILAGLLRILPYAASGIVVLYLAVVWTDRVALQREVRNLEAQHAVAINTAKVMAARAVSEAERAKQATKAVEAILTGDFDNADTLIDPRIAVILECLRSGAAGCETNTD